MNKKLLLLIAFTAIIYLRFNQPNAHPSKNIYIAAASFGNIFDPHPRIGNTQISCCRLKEYLNHSDYNIHQIKNIRHLETPHAIILFDICANVQDLQAYPLENRILFLWEPPSVLSLGYNNYFHHYFGRIYTWNDDLVDNKKYFKFYYPQPSLSMAKHLPFAQKKLCTLIACNKHSKHPQELYSERLKAIEYFEHHHPEEFDFYGMGWNAQEHPMYKGPIDNKIDYLKQYKFCICYENIRGLKGYITEKIFDCFVSGCIPIYWGAENITTYIPENCFIDRRKFANLDEMYAFIANISEKEYETYINNIKEYLASPQAQLFSSDQFIKTFCEAVRIPGHSHTAKSSVAQNGQARIASSIS